MKKKIKWMVISIGLIAFYTFAAAGILCSSEDETLAYGCILAVALAYLPANVAKKKGKEFCRIQRRVCQKMQMSQRKKARNFGLGMHTVFYWE